MSPRTCPCVSQVGLPNCLHGRCPGVEKVADPHAYIKQKFAIVVGDPDLAKRLQVANFDEAEIEELLNWLASQQAAAPQ